MITRSTVASALSTHHPQLNSISGSFVKSESSAQYQCPKRWQSFTICTVLRVSKAIALKSLSFFMCSCRQKCQVLSFSCYIAKHMSTGFCIFCLTCTCKIWKLSKLITWVTSAVAVCFITLHLKHMSFVTSVVNTCSRVVAAILLPLQLSYRVIKAKIGLGWTSWERTGQQLVSNCDAPRSSLCEFALSLDIFKMMVSHLHLGCLLPQIVCEFAAAHLCRAHLRLSCVPWKVCIIFFRFDF